METHGALAFCGQIVKAAFKAQSSAFLNAKRAAKRHSFACRWRSLRPARWEGTDMKQLSTEQRLTRLIELKPQRDEIDREIAVLLGDTRGVPVPLCEI